MQSNLKKLEGKKPGFYKKKIPDFRRKQKRIQKKKNQKKYLILEGKKTNFRKKKTNKLSFVAVENHQAISNCLSILLYK